MKTYYTLTTIVSLATFVLSLTQFQIHRRNLRISLFKERIAVRQAALFLLQLIFNEKLEGKTDSDWYNAMDILNTGIFFI